MKNAKLFFGAGAAVALACLMASPLMAMYQHVEEVEPTLPLPNSDWAEIGKVKNLSSSQIEDSRLSIGFEVLDRDIFDPTKVYDRLALTGIKWARCQTGWAKTEKQKGVYNLKWLDDIVDNLLARGIKPWFNVGFGNPIYMGEMLNPTGVGYVPLYFGDECVNAWKNYIDALSKHFKGRVQYFEIWNESNIDSFWQPKKADPKKYVELVQITGGIIRKNIPDAKIGAVISGSFRSYIARFLEAGGGKYIDFFAVHPYCVVPEDRHDNDTRAIFRLFRQHNPDREISLWQGESGFGSSYPQGHYMKPATDGGEYMQAKWMLRRFTLDLSSGYGLTSLYQCVDLKPGYQMGKGGKPLFAKYGLFENITYREKKAYHILKNYTPIFDNKTVPFAMSFYINTRKCVPEGVGVSRLVDSAKRVETFVRKGYPLVAYWLGEDMQLQMKPIERANIEFAEEGKGFSKPVLIDPISGRVFAYKGKIWGKRDIGMSGMSGVPLADYPLVITDMGAVSDIIELNKK
ncbi:MAG: hypothetical protein IJI37_04570 [Opitutales bacterium]|nr:hypothetical protein [Opitutales bacterium]